MKHIRYISTNKTVCSKPDNIGNDFVVIDFDPEDNVSCRECLALLTAHNKREYEREGMISIVQHHPEPEPEWDPSKSFWAGLLLGAAFMFIMALGFLMLNGF